MGIWNKLLDSALDAMDSVELTGENIKLALVYRRRAAFGNLKNYDEFAYKGTVYVKRQSPKLGCYALELDYPKNRIDLEEHVMVRIK